MQMQMQRLFTLVGWKVTGGFYRRVSTNTKEELPRISMPLKFVKRLEKVLKKQGDNPVNYEALAPTRPKRGRLIIDCSNKKKNHYENTTYRNWNENILFSSGWKQSKRAGERFSVLPTNKKPFFSLTEATSLKFDHFDLDRRVITATHTQFNALRKPTSIQAQAIPEILRCANVLMAAESGSGKTFAYLLPILSTILREKDIANGQRSEPDRKEQSKLEIGALVIVPSRELCIQLDHVLRRLCASLPVTFVSLRTTRDIPHLTASKSEGNSTNSVLNSLDLHRNHPLHDQHANSGNVRRVDILVCTPHVAKQLACSDETDANNEDSAANVVQSVKFGRLRWLVLDEADTLLDESFSSTIAEFVTKARLELQSDAPAAEDEEELAPVAKSQPSAEPTQRFSSYYIDEQSDTSCSKLERDTIPNRLPTPLGTQLILSCATLPALLSTRQSDFQASPSRSNSHSRVQKERERNVNDSVMRHFIPIDSCVRVTTSQVHRLPTHLRHTFIRVRKLERFTQLCTLLSEVLARELRCVVFANQSRAASTLHRLLAENGLFGELLVGKQHDAERDLALRRFASGESLFLVSSDLASRGIDVRCDRVLNYELPSTLVDYLHRAGRAGRLDADRNRPSQGDRVAEYKGHPSFQHVPECTSLVANKWEIERVQRIEASVRRGEPFGADLLASLDRHTVQEEDDVDELDVESDEE